MNERDLLKMAAEAAGMAGMLNWPEGAGPWLRVDPDLSRLWNPFEDDGDALRLAVRMEMDVFVRAGRWTEAVAPMGEPYKAMHGGYPEQATRRAIVMAAALKPSGRPGDWAVRMRAKLDRLREYHEAELWPEDKTPNVRGNRLAPEQE